MISKDSFIKVLEHCAIDRGFSSSSESCSICEYADHKDVMLICRDLVQEAIDELKSEDIFNIPKQHIKNLVDVRYPESFLQRTIAQEECAELIQAVAKYSRWTEEPYHSDKSSLEIRDNIVEELTHVAICLGMLQHYFGITQDEIDAEVKRKALKEHFDLSQYPSRFQEDDAK